MEQKQCPKCKHPVNEQEIRCPHCNMRLKIVCSFCNEINDFGASNCHNCGNLLIKYCPSCNSANFIDSDKCRKCGSQLYISDENSENNELFSEQDNNYVQAEQIEDNQEENIEEYQEEQVTNSQEYYTKEYQTEQLENNQENYNNEAYEINNTEEVLQSDENSVEINSVETESDIDNNDQMISFSDSQELLEELSNIINTTGEETVITAVCAEEGMGKTTIIKTLSDSLMEKGIVPIMAEGSELIKLSSFGCIRDALLKLLTLPDCHPDIKTFYSAQTKELFIQNFETLSEYEVLNFMNFLYPSMNSSYDDLEINYHKTYSLLDKIFQSILSKNEAMFIIDNFDLIDTASYEYINHLISSDIINCFVKLLITYRESQQAELYFPEEITKHVFVKTLKLSNCTENQTRELIKNFINSETIPTEIVLAINEKGKGNIFYTEQFLALLFDAGYLYSDSDKMKFKTEEPIPFLPNNVEEILKLRFSFIKEPILRDSLFVISVMGYKFDKSMFSKILGIAEEQSEEVLQRLSDIMLIQKASDYEYSFKNMVTWVVIFDLAIKDPKFQQICKRVYSIINSYALSNPSMRAIIAKYTGVTDLSANAWIEISKVFAYLGDSVMYATALEQYLIASGYDSKKGELNELQTEAAEKVGKLLYKSEPKKTVEYLTTPIVTAKAAGEHSKIIELCGYLIKACYGIENYTGVLETVDLIINSIDDLSVLDKALIKSKKLHALFKIGNCEEGINLANNEILIPLEEALAKQNDSEYSKSLFNIWFETSINLINLYALQGNKKSIETVENIEEIIHMNNIQNPEYEVKLKLSKAFALAIIGQTQESLFVLEEAEQMPEYHDSKIISQRNLIYSINLINMEEIETLQNSLYEFAKFADDCKDQFGKHIFKLMFAWLKFKMGDYNPSNSIFNEELTYFADEKIVTGALISWLFISQNSLALEGIESAEHIAMKALEISQNPKFSQYHTAVYLQKLIAEINLLKGDKEAAKMYLEKGMLIAKQFGLELAQVHLYRTYAKILEHLLQAGEGDIGQNAVKINKIYQAAITEADKLKNYGLVNKIKDEQNNMLAFCEKNGINLS